MVRKDKHAVIWINDRRKQTRRCICQLPNDIETVIVAWIEGVLGLQVPLVQDLRYLLILIVMVILALFDITLTVGIGLCHQGSVQHTLLLHQQLVQLYLIRLIIMAVLVIMFVVLA